MERLERRTLALAECRAAKDGSEFSGLASVFYRPDESWACDVIAPGAFAADLPEFLERGFVGGMNHDWDCPIGSPLEARETAEGLFVRGSVVETAHGRDVRVLLAAGVVKYLSIGFRVLQREWLESLEEVQAWWESVGYQPTPDDMTRGAQGCRLVKRIKLYEFSPVAVPAQPAAAIADVRGGPRPEVELLGRLERLEERMARLVEGGRWKVEGAGAPTPTPEVLRLTGEDRAGLVARLAAGQEALREARRLGVAV